MYETGQSEDDLPDDNGIYSVVIECSSLFETISLQDGDDANDEPRSMATTHIRHGHDSASRAKVKQLGRSFDLWINYTGALASIDRSLDSRLKDHADIKEMVLDLLEMLQRNLRHICNSSIGKPSADQQDLNDEAWRATEKSIDDLHFMAAAIRRASTQSQKYSLSSRFERNEEFYFESYATTLARRDFPNARRSLCEHLGASIAVRRQRIFRKKMHEEKFSRRRKEAASTSRPVPSETPRLLRPQQSHPRPQSAVQPLVLRALKEKHDIPSSSHGSRSELQSTVVRRIINHGPALSTISSGSSIHTAAIGYPQSPKPSTGDKYCACPYCAKPLESERLHRDATYWENHLDADIQPYVCLSEDCRAPFLFFSGMNKWLEHMNTVHSEDWNRRIHMGTWYCDVDHGDQVHQFNDHADFVAHMKDEKSHPGRKPPTESQIDSLSRKKQKVLTREDQYACPFCDCVPASIMPIIPTSLDQDIKRLLGKHIAQHVKSFTFVTIPIFTDGNDDERASMTSAGDGEKRRLRGKDSRASYPSDMDDLRLRRLDDLGDDSYFESYFDSEETTLPSAETYPDTSETIWGDIGFDNYNYAQRSLTGEESDPVLNHLSQHQTNKAAGSGQAEGRDSESISDKATSPGRGGTAQGDESPTASARGKQSSPSLGENSRSSSRLRSRSPHELQKASEAADSKDQSDYPPRLRPETTHGAAASSSSTKGPYDDIKLENAPSTFLGGIFDRLRRLPESYEKKSRYVLGRTLYASSSALVRAADGPMGKVSIKVITKKASATTAQEAANEINVLRRLKHPNIIEFIDWFESRDKYYIVMQYTAGGDLFERICDQGKFTERVAASVVSQILQAVSYLHDNLIIHQNIKPENIYYLSQDSDSPLVLAGFAHSAILSSPEELVTNRVGTFGYAAPEAMSSEGHGLPADVWSIGVITYTLLCGYSPFRSENMHDLYEECTRGSIVFHERYWKNVSSDAKDFVCQMLIPGVESRLTSQNALRHPWMKDQGPLVPLTAAQVKYRRYRNRMKLRHAIRVVVLDNHVRRLRDRWLTDSESDGQWSPIGDSENAISKLFRAVVKSAVEENNEQAILERLRAESLE
ncbi:hypothetical protein TgHK011_001692 [Trichoderma gracile]|nr:hypothetical protein TgHK011_001692 [Trichoderma gracile]